MASRVDRVEFYFDPMCPWAYQTSLWIREVRRLTGLAIEWRFASLEEFNRPEGKKHPWEREIGYGWTPLRVAALLRRRSMDACDAWYLACGRALHEEGRRPHEVDVARELLASIGEAPSVWDEALADTTTHDDVRADHERAAQHYAGFGVPIIVFPPADDLDTSISGTIGRAVFGPVVAPAPMGDEALALWDLTVAYTRVRGLYEIKTPKTDADVEHIQRAFTPYLTGRTWQSVQHPAR
jgi:protein-disulfide isomerase-like protein with CxxC motif